MAKLRNWNWMLNCIGHKTGRRDLGESESGICCPKRGIHAGECPFINQPPMTLPLRVRVETFDSVILFSAFPLSTL